VLLPRFHCAHMTPLKHTHMFTNIHLLAWITQGIPVTDKEGKVLGKSKVAAESALTQMAVTRYLCSCLCGCICIYYAYACTCVRAHIHTINAKFEQSHTKKLVNFVRIVYAHKRNLQYAQCHMNRNCAIWHLCAADIRVGACGYACKYLHTYIAVASLVSLPRRKVTYICIIRHIHMYTHTGLCFLRPFFCSLL
jgi:hypothetical protein